MFYWQREFRKWKESCIENHQDLQIELSTNFLYCTDGKIYVWLLKRKQNAVVMIKNTLLLLLLLKKLLQYQVFIHHFKTVNKSFYFVLFLYSLRNIKKDYTFLLYKYNSINFSIVLAFGCI